MEITESFVKEILQMDFPTNYQEIYDSSNLIQYLDKKMNAVHGSSKARRNLGNIYAVYSILHFYVDQFYEKKDEYIQFDGYEYTKLLHFFRELYGGSKLQNHPLNSRVNNEFRNKNNEKDLIINNDGKYLIHVDYIYALGNDISRTACRIIEKFVDLLIAKDDALAALLKSMSELTDCSEKKRAIIALLNDDAEARIFEIVSFAILKNHYKNIKVFFGYTLDQLSEEYLCLYKTGRTNANDGGIDFVMRPVGRFFQVTEVNNYDKYLLDIDKVMHFPLTFVVKTTVGKDTMMHDLEDYITKRSGGMRIIEERYHNSIEDIITINELKQWIQELNDDDINEMIRDIDIYYRLEMNIDAEEGESSAEES